MEDNLTVISFLDTFFNYDDAVTWVGRHLDEFPISDYELIDASIKYFNGAWRAGCSFKKFQIQGELFE